MDELLLIGCDNLDREHINLLNTLYERGFYEHLSLLKVFRYDSSIFTEILPPLTMELNICYLPLPKVDLKELKLHSSIINLETLLANNHSTIERIHFGNLNTENVLFLVRNFIKLRKIKFRFLRDVDSLDLVTLNEERKKLDGAKSVTIYLRKTQFDQIMKISNLELVKVKCDPKIWI